MNKENIMSTNNSILFYSKFSTHCKNLLQLMSDMNIDMDTVSLDNKEAKSIVTKSSTFQIKSVPTIISIKDNGVIEVYVGNDAKTFIYSIYQQRIESKSTPPPPLQSSGETPHSSNVEQESEQIPMEDVKNMSARGQSKTATHIKSPTTMTDIKAEAKRMEAERQKQMSEKEIMTNDT